MSRGLGLAEPFRMWTNIAFAVFLALLFGLKPQFGNVGIWIALTGFMATRSLTLFMIYPRLLRTI